MTMLMMVEETKDLLATARNAWRKKTRDESLMAICAAILALQMLNSDFMGWGQQHPDAQRHANRLLASHSAEDQRRMMNIFEVINKDEDPEFRKFIDTLFDPNARVFED
jgi:hypothetical protein